jgi:hypothetical protein
MFALAVGKARTGAALGNPVLTTEGRVTLIDGLLAAAVLVDLSRRELKKVTGHPPAPALALVRPGRCQALPPSIVLPRRNPVQTFPHARSMGPEDRHSN